jgi:hypothetical protein
MFRSNNVRCLISVREFAKVAIVNCGPSIVLCRGRRLTPGRGECVSGPSGCFCIETSAARHQDVWGDM